MLSYNKHFITKADIKNVSKSLKSNLITKGSFLKKFEKKISTCFKSKYCVVTSNATSSFFIISKVLNWGKKDNIIISPMTFVAAANSVVSSNANLIFLDISKKDQIIDPDLVEKKIIELKKKKKKISAIIVTDYAGTPADWKKFYKLKKKYRLTLINDNCHAIGSKYYNDIGYASKYADIVIHSYHPVKNITSGEGGSILTNNKKIYNDCLIIREHGFFKKKNHKIWERDIYISGYNSRLSELNCALGYSQLTRIKKIIQERQKIAFYYNKYFSDHKFIKIMKLNSYAKSSYHLYYLMIDFKNLKINKSKFFHYLKKKYKIILQVHYVPTYKFKLFKKFVKKTDVIKKFPNTEKYYEETFSIPLYIDLSKKKILYICRAIEKTILALKK
mgnify:CR=1 FL=1